jgi:hypothetical protein
VDADRPALTATPAQNKKAVGLAVDRLYFEFALQATAWRCTTDVRSL